MKIIALLFLCLIIPLNVTRGLDDTCTDDKRCKCIRSGVAIDIDCSARGLNEVPRFFHHDNIRSIDLSSNSLREIASNMFGELHNLQYLKMDCNNITKIEPLSFKRLRNLRVLSLKHNGLKELQDKSLIGLRSLQNLSLENNDLPLNKKAYPVGLFRDLQSLKYLNIVRNVPYESLKSGSYPAGTFQSLHSLQELRIDGLYHKSFGQPFRQLQKLKKLVMTSQGAHCTIDQLPRDYFLNLPYLRYIDISYCDVRSVEFGPFLGLKNLSYLDISGNSWLTFKSLYNLTYGLNQTRIEILKLKNIHCTGGVGTILKSCQMENIFNTNLTELHLDQNRLELFENGLAPRLPKTLRKLSIAQNKLTFGRYVLEFASLTNLEVLNGSLQLVPPSPIDVIFQNCIEGSDTPECPKNSDNDILKKTHVPPMYSFDLKPRRGFPFPIRIPPNMKTLYYNQSRLYASIGEGFAATNSLEELHLQDNFIYEWNGPVHGLHSLKYLDFSNNFCSHISKIFLLDAKNLRTLKIGRNSLGKSFQNDENGETFKELSNLENLDISKNEIHHLSKNFLKNARNLVNLDIRNNYISLFTLDISHMKKLQRIDLSNNKLLTLNSHTLNTLSAIFERNHSAVNLLENPLECTCVNMEFLKWVEKNSYHFQNLSSYRCAQMEKVGFKFSNLSKSMFIMRKFCTSYEWLIVVNVVSITVILTLIIARLLYKNRWKIRYLLYMTKLQYRGQLRFEKHNFDYDAFVSYEDEDRWFVINKMLPVLEKEKGLRLLIHSRDFLPGNDVSDNIMSAIRNSKKTVCIISRNYFQSYWCTFEFNMACMENFNARKGENVVFLVLLEDIQSRDLQPKMLDLMEEKSYIQVPEHPEVEVVFWENIVKAISN